MKINEGEFLAIIGLSGSGKTTLIKSLNRLVEPSHGEILFAGKNIANIQGQEVAQLRQQVAMIFQNFNLVSRFSAFKNVMMGRLAFTSSLKSFFGLFSELDQEFVLAQLATVGLSEKRDFRVDRMSGGEQQRVAIARALAQQPKVILADEPVASLDPAICHEVMSYLEKINKTLGMTVICNLHFLGLVRQYATRVVALHEGQIVFDGSPKDLNEVWIEKIYGPKFKEVEVR